MQYAPEVQDDAPNVRDEPWWLTSILILDMKRRNAHATSHMGPYTCILNMDNERDILIDTVLTIGFRPKTSLDKHCKDNECRAITRQQFKRDTNQ